MHPLPTHTFKTRQNHQPSPPEVSESRAEPQMRLCEKRCTSGRPGTARAHGCSAPRCFRASVLSSGQGTSSGGGGG